MARIAFIKLFLPGLELGITQLSAELQRSGHNSLMIFFKNYQVVPIKDAEKYQKTNYHGTLVAARGKEYVYNCYEPFSDTEYMLLIDTLKDFDPDLIGFSLTSGPLNEAAEVTKKLKQSFDVPIIWGGCGPTLEPEKCLNYADMVCINEGEQVIVDIADRIDSGDDLTAVPGIWSRTHNGIKKNSARPPIDLEKIAIPDFEPSRTVTIVEKRKHLGFYPPNSRKQYSIMTSRGCPFACSFCFESLQKEMFGKKNHLRRRSVDIVIRELVEAKAKYRIKSVLFYDNVFTIFPSWLHEFASRYKTEVGLPFWCHTQPNTTSRDIILLLKDAGLTSITMGVQSGSEDILKRYLNRPVTHKELIKAAKVIIDCDIEGFFDFITKIPFESENHLKETFNFLLDFPKEMQTVGFGWMTLFPHYGITKKSQKSSQHNTLSEDTYHYYHKLFLLTRTDLPRDNIRAIGNDPSYREDPSLIDPLLPETLKIHFLPNI